MIHQVFLDAMNHNFFDLAKVNLLVVDECHHAVGKSPYAQIFQIYKERKVDILLLWRLATLLEGAGWLSNILSKIISKNILYGVLSV